MIKQPFIFNLVQNSESLFAALIQYSILQDIKNKHKYKWWEYKTQPLKVQSNRLQKMFNIAARILTLTPAGNDIEPVLITLHWLPILKRIQYKILLLTFKVLHGTAPQYLSELLKPEVTDRTTRQTNTNWLHVPKTRTKTFGDRAFAATAPTLWNSLPIKLRFIDELSAFKTEIKTLLFKSAYKGLW